MIIAGFQKMTLLDYPDKIAALIFTQGCNFACGYCHNAEMIPLCRTQAYNPLLEPENILKFLQRRQGMLDGVVISGGEPTLQPDLAAFMKSIKNMGFLVKLDTNGSNPDILKRLFQEGLIDYTAMDIKYPLEKYRQYVRSTSPDNILESISVIKQSGVPYEFRSTILPRYHSRKDIARMGEMIQGAQRWYLQNFRSGKVLNNELSHERSFRSDELARLERLAQKYATVVGVRS